MNDQGDTVNTWSHYNNNNSLYIYIYIYIYEMKVCVWHMSIPKKI